MSTELTTALHDFTETAEQVGEALGWNACHNFVVEYDSMEVGDLWLMWRIWPGRGDEPRDYDEEEMKQQVQEIIPEAEKIEIFGQEVPDEDDMLAVCLDEGETDDQEDEEGRE